MEEISVDRSLVQKIVLRSIFLFILSIILIVFPIISDSNIIGRILFTLGAAILIIYGVYEIKYAIESSKHGITIDFEDKRIIYSEEFVGEKIILVEDIMKYKVYKKNGRIFMIEVFFDEGKKTKEVLNLASFTKDDTDNILHYMKSMNPHMKEVAK
jgi:arginine exporter protein ArgO